MEDTDASQKLYELSQMFPDIPFERVLSIFYGNGGDVEASITSLLSNPSDKPDENDSDFQLATLFEMFPNIDQDIIRSQLNDCEGDVTRASEAIMAYETTKELEEKWKIEDESVSSATNVDWRSSFEGKIQKLAETTGLKEPLAMKYLRKNESDFCKALVDIVFHHQADVDRIRLEKFRKTKGKVPNGPKNLSRVQGGYNNNSTVSSSGTTISHASEDSNEDGFNTTIGSSLTNDTEYSKVTIDPHEIESEDEEDRYVYSDKNPESVELANMVFSTKILADISWLFYKNALILFKGDKEMALNAGLLLIENDAAELSFSGVDKTLDYTQLFAQTRADHETYSSVASNSSNMKNFTPVMKRRVRAMEKPEHNIEEGFDNGQIALQRNALRSAVQNNHLDLHNFTVANAKATTDYALKRWWEDEQRAREVDGRLLKSTKAYMIPPLTIVTGRGIHSDGGKSKVRHSIKALLEKSPYKYEEETSRFIVVGKK